VLCLVVIDISILGLYMLVEGVRGQLEVQRVMNREKPEDIIGVSKFLRRIDSVALTLVEIQSAFFEKKLVVMSSPITILLAMQFGSSLANC